MRTFIAIEVPEDIKSELNQLIDKLKSSRADVKWVKAQGIHLTLKFLGNVEESKLEEIKQTLNKLTETENPFEISLEGLGAFPKPAFARVIWVGIKQGNESTINLAKKLEDELEKIGFKKEKRPFSPHLTLGRLRSPKNRDKLASLLNSINFQSQSSIKVIGISLIQSTLTPTGAIYNLLYQAPLSK
jgi:2'-5' RNA ligase